MFSNLFNNTALSHFKMKQLQQEKSSDFPKTQSQTALNPEVLAPRAQLSLSTHWHMVGI